MLVYEPDLSFIRPYVDMTCNCVMSFWFRRQSSQTAVLPLYKVVRICGILVRKGDGGH